MSIRAGWLWFIGNLLLGWSPACLWSQSPPTKFPEAWVGTWKGKIATDAPNASEFTLELNIQPTDDPDRFQWTMVYDGEAGQSIRSYHLVIKDRDRGDYIIDEGNGIELEARFFADTLRSTFRAGANYLAVTYRLTDGAADRKLVFDLMTFEQGERKNDGMMMVESLSILNFQRGDLQATTESMVNGVRLDAKWQKQTTDNYTGKQDDIFFLDSQRGWYVNGAGKIYHTTDGGQNWRMQLEQPGTFFRCIAFFDDKIGIAGNIGPGYFPNVTDSTPLYRTTDGGETWTAITLDESFGVTGLCAIQILQREFINAGVLDKRPRMIAAGRVGGPAAAIYSDDLGATWNKLPIDERAKMVLDLHFFDDQRGLLAAATDSEVSRSHGLILLTRNGGESWEVAYESSRSYELLWKMSFPNSLTGFATLQSYDPDPQVTQRFVLKTFDGGESWTELPLVSDFKVREFGIGFIDESIGWVGAVPHGFQTTNGGQTWEPADLGNAVNKIRILHEPEGTVGFAIGTHVHRIDIPKKQ